MPHKKVDILSFICRDEQDHGTFGSQDETYAFIRHDRGTEYSETYRKLDTGDKINVRMDPVKIDPGGVLIGLYEDDPPINEHGPEDDILGQVLVKHSESLGEHTQTLQDSGGEYDLTYLIA